MNYFVARRAINRIGDPLIQRWAESCLSQGISMASMRFALQAGRQATADGWLEAALRMADAREGLWSAMTLAQRRRALRLLERHPELTVDVR